MAVVVGCVAGRCRLAREVSCRGIAILALHSAEVAGADLGPESASNLAMAAKCAVGPTAVARAASFPIASAKDMVLVVLDGLGGEKMGELVAARVLIGPLLDSGIHVTLNLDLVVSGSGVVERADHIVDDFVNWDRRVLPGVENSTSCG